MTDSTQQRFDVRHQPEQSRYALVDTQVEDAAQQVIGKEDYVDVEGGERILFHTEVSEDYAGQSLASVLVQHVVDDTIAQGLSIVPVCPYVAKWLPKHPEYDEHVVKPTPAHLQAVPSRRP